MLLPSYCHWKHGGEKTMDFTWRARKKWGTDRLDPGTMWVSLENPNGNHRNNVGFSWESCLIIAVFVFLERCMTIFKLETTNIPLSFHWILVGLGSSKHQTTWRSPTMEDADGGTPTPHPMVSPMTLETEKPSCVIKRGNCKSTWNEAFKFGKSPGNSLLSISMFDYRRGSPKSLKSTDGLTLGPPHDENWEASGSNGQG